MWMALARAFHHRIESLPYKWVIYRQILNYKTLQQYTDSIWAPVINTFYRKYLTPYINVHRPCYFAEIKIDKKGKEKKTYPYHSMMTPYEKLKSLPNAAGYLKADASFESLDKQMMAQSDLQAAKAMKQAQSEMFRLIFNFSLSGKTNEGGE
jgi:hypothetical protein